MLRRPRTPAEHEAGVLRKWARHDNRMEGVERFGIDYIYPTGYDEREIETLRSEISRKTGFALPEPEIGPISQDEGGWHEILGRVALCGACGGDDLMEFEHENGFGCEGCHALTYVVFGCLNCTHIRCPECVPLRRSGAGSLTPLSVIAESFEVSRSRAGQVLDRAMRKLRHPSRAKLLAPFLEETAIDRRPAPRHPPSTVRPSWTALALAEDAQRVDPATLSTCNNCRRFPEVLRVCTLCGGQICAKCSGDTAVPTCSRTVWVALDSCRARQAQRDLRDSHGPR